MHVMKPHQPVADPTKHLSCSARSLQQGKVERERRCALAVLCFIQRKHTSLPSAAHWPEIATCLTAMPRGLGDGTA